MEPGDSIIDGGGNWYFKDDVRRAGLLHGARYPLHERPARSGGVWGAERGYCLMIGGHKTRPYLVWIRSSRLFAPGSGDIARTARASEKAPRRGKGDPLLRSIRSRGTSSKWCTTGSNTV